MTATVVVHHQLLSGADQVAIGVCTSVITVGVVAVLRWARKVAHSAIEAMGAVKDFGRQWAEAATVVEEIHLIRHDQLGHFAKEQLTAHVLTRIAEHLGVVTTEPTRT